MGIYYGIYKGTLFELFGPKIHLFFSYPQNVSFALMDKTQADLARRSQILGCYNSVKLCIKSVQLHTHLHRWKICHSSVLNTNEKLQLCT